MVRSGISGGIAAGACALVVFTAILTVVDAQDACPQVEQAKDELPQGHFISATISWSKDEASGDDNAVIFEIISTWRRNHTWPCNRKIPFTGPGRRPGLGDIVPIVGISAASFNNRTGSVQPIQVQSGQFTARLDTGDNGIGYDVKLQVTSFSVVEDWITGVSYIRHVYSAPYGGRVPLFPAKYVASVTNKDSTQPYQTVPWTATFGSCCRRWPGQDGQLTFSIYSKVDLSDNIGSPRIVSLPQLWLSAGRGNNRIYMCAVAVAGKSSMFSMSGGTLNDDSDDMLPIGFDWQVLGGSANARFEDNSPAAASNCRKLLVPRVYNVGATPVKDYISIVAKLGRAEVSADLPIHILPIGTALAPVPQRQTLPFTCAETDDCQVRVSLGQPLTNSIAPTGTPKTGNLSYFQGGGPNETPLEIRYVIGRGRMQSALLATSDSRVVYSKTVVGLDHAGLPNGATLNPVSRVVTGCLADVATCPGDLQTSCKYVTDVAVSFSSSMVNARPLHDVPYAAPSRDYSAQVGNSDVESNALAARGYVRVQASNFNNMSGGATVGVWLQRDPLMSAVTDVIIVNSSQVAQAMSDGFTKLDRNLLEQSARGQLFIMFKRGSGPSVLDIRTTPPTHCSHCYACDDWTNQTTRAVSGNGGYMQVRGEAWSDGNMAAVTLWVKKGVDKSVRRRLDWMPCTGDDEDWVMCAQGAQTQGTMSTQMQCILMQVQAKPPPEFLDCSTLSCAGDSADLPVNGVYQAYMGVKLRIPLEIEQRSGSVGENVEISFTDNGKPVDVPFLDDVITARTPTGYYIASLPDGRPSEGNVSLAPSGLGDNPSLTRVRGYIVWTPSPYQGGWKGQVCVRACVGNSLCPAVKGGSGKLCSEPKCFNVSVERCKWAVQREDSFVTIAPRFQTNWLQLWYANPWVGHPDFSLLPNGGDSQQLINVGRVYKARWDDTVQTVTDRFGITVQRLKDLNADLALKKRTDNMPIDQDLCIIPDSCSVSEPSNAGKNQ